MRLEECLAHGLQFEISSAIRNNPPAFCPVMPTQKTAQSKLPERILVRGTNWLGDAVMTLPALRRLRRSFPAAHVTLLATPRTTGLFSDAALVDEVLPYRRREEGVRAFLQTAKLLRAQPFDLALLFQNAFEAALLSWLGGIPQRLGYAAQGRSPLLTARLEHSPAHRNRHQIHDYLDLVLLAERLYLAEPPAPPTAAELLPQLHASVAETQAAAQLLRQHSLDATPRPLVVLNAGATNSRAKCWPASYFAALADRLVASHRAQIVLIGAASERANAAQVIEQMQTPAALNLAGATSLAELTGLLACCALLVSNDTGPAHIGAALGRPTLTLFGPTNEFETAPTGSRAELLRVDDIECARCMHRVCPIDHRCMTRLTVEMVFARASRLLAT